MPIYFAYGANLDHAGMAERCPGAAPLGPATLDHHRFFIMESGFASVCEERNAVVHGLLWALTEGHVTALDQYEEVADGLYRKHLVAVTGPDNTVVQAMIYVGMNTTAGRPRDGYMEAVLAAADANDLPETYLEELRQWLPAERP
jgi:gamma-glutamylcyclotransferase (GGCT)/AIG2-like uncharacterized protein YtfP